MVKFNERSTRKQSNETLQNENAVMHFYSLLVAFLFSTCAHFILNQIVDINLISSKIIKTAFKKNPTNFYLFSKFSSKNNGKSN